MITPKSLSPLLRASLTALTLAHVAGCGFGQTTSCDFRGSGEDRCQERSGIQGNPLFGSTCETVGGVEAEGECPDADQIVGGCLVSGGGDDVIDWYYAPMTVEEIQTLCDENGETYTAP